VLFETIVKLLGKSRRDRCDWTNLLELPEEELEEEQMGGAAVMITPEECRNQIREFWDNESSRRLK